MLWHLHGPLTYDKGGKIHWGKEGKILSPTEDEFPVTLYMELAQ